MSKVFISSVAGSIPVDPEGTVQDFIDRMCNRLISVTLGTNSTETAACLLIDSDLCFLYLEEV